MLMWWENQRALETGKKLLDETIIMLSKTCEAIGAEDEFFRDLAMPKQLHVEKIRPNIGGGKEVLYAYRVWHYNPYRTGTDPYKGGFRFHPDVTPDLLTVLAMKMTEKCALANLQFGGAKGGIAIDPSKLTETELENITHKLTEQFLASGILHPTVDVFGQDVGTNSKTMDWIFTRVSDLGRFVNINAAAVVTGKPETGLHGIHGREDATARGGLIVLREFIALSRTLPERPRLVIQGFGNVGSNMMRIASDPQEGFMYPVVAVGDEHGGLWNPEGLRYQSVYEWYCEHKSFRGYPNAEEISSKDLLLLETDILVPAAIENQIVAANTEHIKTQVILEMANEAVTQETHNVLKQRGIVHIPGIAANVGGVVFSWVEWSRNYGIRWHTVDKHRVEADAQEHLRKNMEDVIQSIFHKQQKEMCTLEEAAHRLALERIYRLWKPKHH